MCIPNFCAAGLVAAARVNSYTLQYCTHLACVMCAAVVQTVSTDRFQSFRQGVVAHRQEVLNINTDADYEGPPEFSKSAQLVVGAVMIAGWL